MTWLALTFIGAEVVAWSGSLQAYLLRRAARSLPAGERERYVEEWLAELHEVPAGPLTRVLWVASIYLRRRSMAQVFHVENRRGVGIERAVDVGVAAVLVVLVVPVLLLVGVAVAVGHGRPVLWRQLRVDSEGRSFEVLKFRTALHPRQPTELGRFLLRWNLDELPQLLNVLRGDVSLVGLARKRPGPPQRGSTRR